MTPSDQITRRLKALSKMLGVATNALREITKGREYRNGVKGPSDESITAAQALTEISTIMEEAK